MTNENRLDKQQVSELQTKLVAYRDSLVGIDTTLNSNLENNISVQIALIDSLIENVMRFNRIFGQRSSEEANLSLLNSFETNIKITENRIIDYCNRHCSQMVIIEEWPAFFSNINSDNIRLGEKITILSGYCDHSEISANNNNYR